MSKGVLHKFEQPSKRERQAEEFRRILYELSDEDKALLVEYMRALLRCQELRRRLLAD